MTSRAVRVLLVIVAIAAQAGAAVAVWRFEQQIGTARSAADAFERDARQAAIHLAELRAAQQAYVAEGQPTDTWLARATALTESIAPELAALRLAAGSAEAQGALETAIETFSTVLARSDARAREFLKTGQRFSASEVIFTDGASTLTKIVNAIDGARGQESIARAVVVAGLREWQLSAIGAAVALTLLALLLLVRIPGDSAGHGAEQSGAASLDAGQLGLARAAGGLRDAVAPASAPAAAVVSGEDNPLAGIDLDAGLHALGSPEMKTVADICSSLARVERSSELQGLLERIAKALGASGVIVWMPSSPGSALRPVLSHGYAPLALGRMGSIDPASDNATATAFRTGKLLVVPSEPMAGGAIVAPLITADGCSGAMALELRERVEATEDLRAAATILGAQLATLFTPAAPAAAAVAPSPTPAATDPAGTLDRKPWPGQP